MAAMAAMGPASDANVDAPAPKVWYQNQILNMALAGLLAGLPWWVMRRVM